VTIFAPDRLVQDVKECYFYHSMDIPGYGAVTGEWDLRHRMSDYLGNISFDGKRVLEMGTADGFACFYMESQGAEVVAFDLSGAETWDVVPFARDNSKIFNVERKHHIERLNNAFWLSHRAFRSKSRMVYGNAYSIPAEIGEVDIATFWVDPSAPPRPVSGSPSGSALDQGNRRGHGPGRTPGRSSRGAAMASEPAQESRSTGNEVPS